MAELVAATPKRGRQRKVPKAEEIGDGDVLPGAMMKRKRKVAASTEEVREVKTSSRDVEDKLESKSIPTTKKENGAGARVAKGTRECSALVSGNSSEVNETSDRLAATQKPKATPRKRATAKSVSDDILEPVVGSGRSKDEPTRASEKAEDVVGSYRKAKAMPKSKSTVKSSIETAPSAESISTTKSKTKSSSPILDAVEAVKAARQGTENASSRAAESQRTSVSEKVASSDRADQQGPEAEGSQKPSQNTQGADIINQSSSENTILTTPFTNSVLTNNAETTITSSLPGDEPSPKPIATPSKQSSSILHSLSSLSTSKSKTPSSSTSPSSPPSTSNSTNLNTITPAKLSSKQIPTSKSRPSAPPPPASYAPPNPATTPSLAPAARARAPLPPLPNPPPPSPPFDIRKTPRFKSLSWRWTSGIVGLSVFIATSYELYHRVFVDPERGAKERPGRSGVLESGLPGVDRRREGGGGARPRVLKVEGGAAGRGTLMGGSGGAVEEMKFRRNGNGNDNRPGHASVRGEDKGRRLLDD
ncbi:MAG: hypothetical protein Q9160_004365 [Pyrenula sp. 1 TL-2023]